MPNIKMHEQQNLTVAYFAWASVALFFFYQYLLRVAPGVMIDEIRHDFGVNADQFATLGSFYLYAYSLLQIPLGFIVDRIGVKRTILASIVLCLAGSALIAYSHLFLLAQFSRILIGAGSASAFMCSLKIVADRLPPGSRGFLMGATLTLGTVGALVAGKPLVYFLDSAGWRTTMLYTTAIGIIILISAFLFLPKRAQNRPILAQESIKSEAKNLLSLIQNKQIILYAFLAVGLYAPLSALADLWGTAFLMQKFSLPRAEAAHTTMMMYIGLAIGSLFMPWMCEKYNILNRAIQACGLGIITLFAFLLYGPEINTMQLTILLLCLGFFCGAEMMCFAGALLYANPNNSGLTIGVVNTFNMLGGALLQQFIGYSLDFQWNGLLDEQNIRIYNTHQFEVALSVLTVIIILCCLASFQLIRKKHKVIA
jgi:predicted MFS family arabinose efflux permease